MLPPTDNVFLIGYRGTGKSTAGRIVAERLGYAFFDTDVEIERRAGTSIAEIFATQGEAAFRGLEADMLDELSRAEHRVLALGGGAVLRPGNRAKLKTRGRTAWLVAQPATLWQRIGADPATAPRRPNLTAAGGPTEIVAVLARRLPVYRECADCVVDTEGRTADEVAGLIVAQFQQPAAGSQP